MRCSRYVRFALQFTPTIIIPEPNQVAFTIGHFSRDADLVAVEVVGLLSAFAIFSCPVVDLRQGVVRTGHALRRDWKFHAGYDLLHYMYLYHYLNCQDNDFYIRRRSSENHFIQACKLEMYCNYFFMIIFFPVLFVER